MAFKKLVIPSGKVIGSSHSNFPILIQPSLMTGWESLTLAEAESIRIYTDEAKTNEVAREVVSSDEIYCKVPTLTSSTELYVDYDGVGSDYAAGATYGRNAVWGEFLGVWHMTDATSSTVIDSTGNGYSGTKGSANNPLEVAGKIGKAQRFSGSDYIDTADIEMHGEANLTVSCWFVDNASGGSTRLVSKDQIGIQGAFMFWLAGGGDLTFQAHDGSSFRVATYGGYTRDTAKHFAVGRLDDSANELSVWYDGVKQGTAVFNGTLDDSDNEMVTFGADSDIISAKGHNWNGDIDEVRIANVSRAGTWLETEYNNQDDVASFWGTVTEVITTPTWQATGNGNVTDDGGATITERGVCWSITANPTTADSKSISAGTTGVFTADITGLTADTLYYVRAYAINRKGTSYGAQVTFTTDAAAPTSPVSLKQGGVFGVVTTKVKVGGTFQDVTPKIKVGGVF